MEWTYYIISAALVFLLGLFAGRMTYGKNDVIDLNDLEGPPGFIKQRVYSMFEKKHKAYVPSKDPERQLDGKEYSYFEEQED